MAIKKPTAGNNPSELFETSDLYLAGFLRASGARLVRTGQDGPRVVFSLEGSGIQELARAYYQDGQVGALAFTASIRDLKALVHGRAGFIFGPPAQG